MQVMHAPKYQNDILLLHTLCYFLSKLCHFKLWKMKTEHFTAMHNDM